MAKGRRSRAEANDGVDAASSRLYEEAAVCERISRKHANTSSGSAVRSFAAADAVVIARDGQTRHRSVDAATRLPTTSAHGAWIERMREQREGAERTRLRWKGVSSCDSVDGRSVRYVERGERSVGRRRE